MTIKASQNVTIREPQTDNRCNDVWRIEDGHHWNSATECARDIGVCLPTMYGALNGKSKTCKGYHYAYGKDVLKVQRLMGKRIADMTEVMNQLQADAAVGRAIREAEEERKTALEKARQKRDTYYNKYILAMELYENAERELAELEDEMK